jgi:hypothetical protein
LQSATYADFRQLQSRETQAKAVAVPATLGFPDVAKERYPAVVVLHTVAGYIEANDRLGKIGSVVRAVALATGRIHYLFAFVPGSEVEIALPVE